MRRQLRWAKARLETRYSRLEEGVVVALGALGIVTRVTLDIEPAFTMRQDAFEGLTWATLLAELDAVMSAGTASASLPPGRARQ